MSTVQGNVTARKPADQERRLADDLLYGAKAIADELGIEERQARWQIDQGNIQGVTRMGRLIVCSKSALRRQFAPHQDSAA